MVSIQIIENIRKKVNDLGSSQEIREVVRICDKLIAKDQMEMDDMAKAQIKQESYA